MEGKYTFSDLQDIVRKLRSEDGCPWDRVQTHESLERCMIEEAYEAVEGIRLLGETGDGENLCEELGDVLLQVVFHSQLAQEEGIFDLEDVVQGVSEKMIRRHPHVFGSGQAEDDGQVRKNWEEIKKEEKKGKQDQRSELESVPKAFPALMRALKVIKKLDKGEADAKRQIGELLYGICGLARQLGVDPEEALSQEVERNIADWADNT